MRKKGFKHSEETKLKIAKSRKKYTGKNAANWKGGKIFPYEVENYDGQRLQVVSANKKVHPELLELLMS